jgi:hypothetical protein
MDQLGTHPGGKDMPKGGTTTSTSVVVDFEGTVSGHGSHIDLKIDNDRYYPVASPHTISGLSEGFHEIFLRAVDQDDNVDRTLAKWTFLLSKTMTTTTTTTITAILSMMVLPEPFSNRLV